MVVRPAPFHADGEITDAESSGAGRVHDRCEHAELGVRRKSELENRRDQPTARLIGIAVPFTAGLDFQKTRRDRAGMGRDRWALRLNGAWIGLCAGARRVSRHRRDERNDEPVLQDAVTGGGVRDFIKSNSRAWRAM